MNTWFVLTSLSAVLAGCSLSGPQASDDGAGGSATSSSSSVGANASSQGSGGSSVSSGTGAGATGLPVLGNLAHSLAAVQLDELGSGADGLASPSDVAIHPDSGELWITNRAADSMTIIGQTTVTRYDGDTGQHFLANPAGLAFGAAGRMATIHEEDQLTQGNQTPADFMGPTLWPSSASAFDGGHYSHLDMLHNSPNGMGIAWEAGNAYWVFDGYHASLTRYDFHQDHGPGGTDHTDGEIARYVQGQVSRVPGVPSNLVYDPASGLLYVADTGNNRIAVLDTNSGTAGGFIGPDYDGADQYEVLGASFTTLIEGADHGLERPSGLEIRDGVIFVSDNATSTIYGFDMAGTLLDWLPTEFPPGCLGGMAMDAEGRLVVVDAPGARVLRITARN